MVRHIEREFSAAPTNDHESNKDGARPSSLESATASNEETSTDSTATSSRVSLKQAATGTRVTAILT